MRNVTGYVIDGIRGGIALGYQAADGAFYLTKTQGALINASSSTQEHTFIARLDASRIVPTGPHTSPRAWGSLACVYLGRPAS